ncbi:DUF4190 domain-containing protein [Micrococcoides hystricis]|uniref:DUF4190 domain-containing protein n=1 Tax=Micrococcoides hystricis TaxID=1572761 RepID=A0ABV6PE06_9MICC
MTLEPQRPEHQYRYDPNVTGTHEPSQQLYAGYMGKPQGTGLAITSLITGILSFLTSLFPFLSALLGITAVITGGIGLAKKRHKGLSMAGVILGALGLVINVAVSILVLMPGGILDSLNDSLNT